jgi:hypothetical protein
MHSNAGQEGTIENLCLAHGRGEPPQRHARRTSFSPVYHGVKEETSARDGGTAARNLSFERGLSGASLE